ncbi:uncharacterized protein [Lolium perenne]|uniref:uncharacterized protein isoform X1 n=2 Tax=Lolium perenne TaxID=4522 RepID=UPI0021F53A08|nr:uncharacterized protein LOC127324046 isoform X1 [Lolium perenne]
MGASAATVNATCKLVKNETTATLGYSSVGALLESPSVHMEVLVLLTPMAYLVVATLGSQRRRSTSWFIQKGLFVAHTLSFPLGAYTLGSMQSHSAAKSCMYSLWAGSLFILHACTDTSYKLDDIKQVTRSQYRYLLYYANGYLLLRTLLAAGNSSLYFLVTPLYIIAMLKLDFLKAPCVLSSSSWNLNKMVADYMYNEHTRGKFVPATMEGCHYLVDWPLNKSKLDAPSYAAQLTGHVDHVIDIEKIWLCSNLSLDQELKDTCLSFSLFHLLRRRFFGFTCGESKERAHDFVFKGLLLENEKGVTDCNRVFRVIETELAFMYDFFFTKSAVIYYGSSVAMITCLLSVMFLSLIILWTVRSQEGKEMTDSDTVISLFVLASAASLELLQLLLYWTSIWSRVSFVCGYVREQARWNTWGGCWCCMTIRLNGVFAKIGVHCAPNKHYWQHKLGQYSLLDFKPKWKLTGYFDAPPTPGHRCGIFQQTNMYLFDKKQTNTYVRRVRGKQGKSIEVPAQVKKALIYSLKRTNGVLTNGKSSLVSNEAGHLSWACARDLHSASDTSSIIMTWHIATWYCEMGTTRYGPSYPDEGELKTHLGVATKLSKYCTYLVVHVPKLLPGHHYDTSRVFDAVAVEANKFLLPSMRRRAKYEALRNYGLEESEATIFQSGAKLGKQLEEIQDATRRWKVLADFWSEMMLYVAPSDDVNEHIDQLTRGGELITHLWALLSHAGILQRDQPGTPPSHRPRAESTRSSHQEIFEQDAARYEGATTTLADHLATTSPARHLADNPQMSGATLQDVLKADRLPQAPVLPDIAKSNDCHIDVPEDSIHTRESHP